VLDITIAGLACRVTAVCQVCLRLKGDVWMDFSHCGTGAY
jgi:hypothetical protein